MPHRVVAILAFLVGGTASVFAQPPPLNACGAIPCPRETLQAENRLAEAWRDAWPTTVRPASLLVMAAGWRTTLESYAADLRRPSFTPAERRRRVEHIREHLEYHERALREWNRQDRAVRGAAARDGAPASDGACFGAVLTSCRTVGSGELRAASGAPRLAWQTQEGRISDRDGHAGTVVLASGPDGWRPVAWAFSESSFQPHRPPILAERDGAVFLVVPGGEGSFGRQPPPLVYRYGNDVWTEIETISWAESLQRSEPTRTGWYHVHTDIGTMTGSVQAGPGGEAGLIRDRRRRSVPLRVEGTSLVLADEPPAPRP